MILHLVSCNENCKQSSTFLDSATTWLIQSFDPTPSDNYHVRTELRKFPFGILAAQPEEVAADLVPKILGIKTNGGIVEFLTTDKILTKFFERFILQKKSKYIDDDGNVIRFPGEEYDADGVRALF